MFCAFLAAAILHVSPVGDDAAAGTVEAPLASLEGARDRLRYLRSSGALKDGATVWIADGTYVCTNAFVLTESDSGAPGAPIVYRAANRSHAILSGGVSLVWRKTFPDDPFLNVLPESARGQVYVADLPGSCPSFAGGGMEPRPKHCPFGLFEQDRRLPLAAWPEDGSSERLGLSPFRDVWTNDAACWFWTAPQFLWDDRRVSATNRAALAKLTGTARYRVFNSAACLDGPGKWVVDAAGRRVCLWPSVGTREIVLANQENLLECRRVRHVVFDGLVFAYARGTPVLFCESSDVVLLGCTIRHTMGDGVDVRGGHNCMIDSCDLWDLGLGGVSLAGGVRNTLQPSGHIVRNCHIWDFGRYEWNYRPGVSLSGVGARCEHNLIHHARHQAVAFSGNDQYVGYNVIHDVCRGNEDSGAIYIYTDYDWSCGRGSVIEYNLVHAIGTQPHGTFAFGIYIDGYASGVKVRHNIVSQVEYGIFQSGGQANVFEQNLVLSTLTPLARRNYGLMGGKTPYHHVADGRDCLLYRNLLADRAVFETPVWKAHSPKLLNILTFKDPIWAQNSLYSVITNNLCVKSGSCEFLDLDIMPGYYTITNNVTDIDDPGFVDWKGKDWTLAENGFSASRLGSSRFSEMGLVRNRFRPTEAIKFGKCCSPILGERLRPPSRVRIDVVFEDRYSPADPCADHLCCCDVPDWDASRRYVVADFGITDIPGEWKDYVFSFVPRHDDFVSFDLVGGFGYKTYFDAIEVEGAHLKNSDFEGASDWTWANEPAAMWPTYRLRSTDLSMPRGLVGMTNGICPAQGRRMAAATEIFRVQQRVRVNAGVPVVVRFKACGGN